MASELVRTRAALLIWAALWAATAPIPSLAARPPAPHPDIVRAWPETDARLDVLIATAAYRYQLPISAVLRAPLPRLRIPRGSYTAAELLAILSKARPGYSWTRMRGAVWLVADSVRGQKQNFMNWRLPRVDFQGSVESFLPQLIALATAAPKVPRTFAASYPPVPRLDTPLPGYEARDITVRAALRRVMEFRPKFYSIVIYPDSSELTRKDALAALANWRWGALAAPPPAAPRGGAVVSAPPPAPQ